MIIKVDPPWYPTSVRGNYLYWKNANTGDTRKSYISEGQLAQVKKEVGKYHKLVSGMGYPWTPVRYDGEYIVYKSATTGLETKSFVPPEMREDVAKFLRASGEPGKARVIDLHSVGKGKYAYIERKKFTDLREALSRQEQELMTLNLFEKYTKRTGVVEQVLDAETILVDGVVVKIKYAQAPDFRKNLALWTEGKQYLESIILNQSVVLKIDLNVPTDERGTTVAEVFLKGEPKYLPQSKVINLTLPPYAFSNPNKSAVYPGGEVPLINFNSTTGKLQLFSVTGKKYNELIMGESLVKKEQYETSVYNLLAISGYAKTYEMMKFEKEESERKYKAERSAFFQQLVQSQQELPPSERDRAQEFGGLDWLGIFAYYPQAEAINILKFIKTGTYGSLSYKDKIIAGAIFRQRYEEWVVMQNMLHPRDINTPKLGIMKMRDWAAPFMIELAGNIGGDISSLFGFGRGILTKVWTVGSKEYPATHALEQLYIQLARTRGEREAKWLAIAAAKQTPQLYIQLEGLRILGTNYEFVSQATIKTITSPIWKAATFSLQPVKFIAEGTPTQIVKIIDYLKSIGRKQDVISVEELQRVKAEYKQMTDKKRLQKQLASTDIWILKQEAKQTFTEIKESNVASAIESLKQYKEISKRDIDAQKALLRTISEFKTSSELDIIREALEVELKTSQEESRAALKFISGEFKTDLDKKINTITRQIALADLKAKAGFEIYQFEFGTKATERAILESSKRELTEMEAIREAIESANIDALSGKVKNEWQINKDFERLYGETITNLVERGEALSPKVGIITRQLEKMNKDVALRETERGLLTTERSWYVRHWLTPEARAYFGIQEPVLSKLAVKNLFNMERKQVGTIEAINKDYMRKYGFNLFEPNAFKIQEYRLFESIEAVETYDYLMWIKQMYGITPEQELAANFLRRFWKNAPSGYSKSKIALLDDVYLPTSLVRQLESDPMFALHIKTARPKTWGEQALRGSDTVQRIWKFTVTFGDPSWLPSNVQSGIYVAWMYSKITELSSYTNAWKELARKSALLSKVFKMSSEGGYFTDVYGNKILASELIAEAKELNVLGVEGMGDVSRNYKFGMSDTLPQKIQKAASWAMKNSEDMIRYPMYHDLRINKGKSAEEAANIVMRTQGNYGKSALSPFESEVMTRLTNFYVWYKFAPALVAKQLIAEPRTLTIPYHMMNAWNGDRGDVERTYFTERQLMKTMFRVPGTDAYTAPAIFSLANSAYKWMYVLESKERGFYWSELKKDPNLLIKFLEYEIDVDWLKRGGGKVSVQGNRSTITYDLTGDSVSAHLNSTTNKLTIIDDSTGRTIKEFPFDSPEGKPRIYKEMSLIDTIERAVGLFHLRSFHLLHHDDLPVLFNQFWNK